MSYHIFLISSASHLSYTQFLAILLYSCGDNLYQYFSFDTFHSKLIQHCARANPATTGILDNCRVVLPGMKMVQIVSDRSRLFFNTDFVSSDSIGLETDTDSVADYPSNMDTIIRRFRGQISAVYIPYFSLTHLCDTPSSHKYMLFLDIDTVLETQL